MRKVKKFLIKKTRRVLSKRRVRFPPRLTDGRPRAEQFNPQESRFGRTRLTTTVTGRWARKTHHMIINTDVVVHSKNVVGRTRIH